MSSAVVKRGYAAVREDGLRSFLWPKRWLLLREQTLTFHRNENTYQAMALMFLREITEVRRVELKPYCFEIVTREKSYFISCKNDAELYSWMDEVYQRSPLGASNPTNFEHKVHVGFDPMSGGFTGLPTEWDRLLQGSNISKKEMEENPQAVLDVLRFYTDTMKPSTAIKSVDPATKPGSTVAPIAPKRFSKLQQPDLASSQPSLSFMKPGSLGNEASVLTKSSSVEDTYQQGMTKEIAGMSVSSPPSKSSPQVQRTIIPPPDRPPYVPRPSNTYNTGNSSNNTPAKPTPTPRPAPPPGPAREGPKLTRPPQPPKPETAPPPRPPKDQEPAPPKIIDEKPPAKVVQESSTQNTTEPAPSPAPKGQRYSKMSDAQLMEKLRGIVTAGDPTKLFQKIKKIGQGASGSVYVAKKLDTRQTVAIKQMDLAAQPRKELIINEIFVMKESKHENIVNFVDSFLVGNTELWVIMEFMEGGSLTDVIDSNKMVEAQISCICLQTIRGLAHLHSQNIIHRDIKSDNVLLDGEGRVKITDFGFCAKLTEDRGKRATMVGTPYWVRISFTLRKV
eukprot:Partr_v1_DN27550_c0_g2_i4_m30209 putative p21 protein (Cdc42 Rac)-activated kinase